MNEVWKDYRLDEYSRAWAALNALRICLPCLTLLPAGTDDKRQYCHEACLNAARSRTSRSRSETRQSANCYYPGFPICLWYCCPSDQLSCLDCRGVRERNEATEGDTQWVNRSGPRIVDSVLSEITHLRLEARRMIASFPLGHLLLLCLDGNVVQKIPLSSVDQLSNRWGPPLIKH